MLVAVKRKGSDLSTYDNERAVKRPHEEVIQIS